jgi:hypothetical protein
MSAITIHEYAAEANVASPGGGFLIQGTGDAVDVSPHAVLRLTIAIDANLGASPQADLWIETAPASTGPWAIAWSRRMSTGVPAGNGDAAWHPRPRAVIGAVDSFARLRWSVRGGNAGLGLSIGCTGEGIPDAS